MRTKLTTYVRRHAIALVALFFALGGTSYAVARLPRNSVGTRQLRNNAVISSKVKDRSLLARDFKPGQLPAGPAGPTGAQGAAGSQGPQGPKGGPTYRKTIFVTNTGASAANGASLRQALASILSASPSATNQYLVRIEPGTYDIGTDPLVLPSYTRIEGAGMGAPGSHPTLIKAAVAGDAAVKGAPFAELSSLTVSNSPPAAAGATGFQATNAPGVRLDSVRVTATAANTAGVFVVGGSTFILNSEIDTIGTGGGVTSNGVYVGPGPAPPTLVLRASTVAAGAATTAEGVLQNSGTGTIENSLVSAGTDAVHSLGTAKVRVGTSILNGAATKAAPDNLVCAFTYDGSYNVKTC